MRILDGKRAVIVGLASNRSIAWGIARALRSQGAELAFNYQTVKLRGRVEKMAGQLESDIVLPLDVSEDAQIDSFFDALAGHWDGFDILVHSVAYAPADQLAGRYLGAVNREGFRIAHDISSYSLAALAKIARPMMLGRQAALLTLSYLGAVRALPSYNVMGLAKASLEANVRFLAHDLGPDGIRVNAISAGPIRTLAASGIKGLRQMLAHVSEAAPLRRNVTIDDVGNAASFLVSDLAAGITGEILYVDAGYNIVGMHMPSTP
ncbi:MAG: enoyl-ACP reductase [Rhodospirillaceae bacterium]|nr:enoyl-ACP reductase [Rhodospirillaceae bacterium]MDE0000254.1 enoyl-ACP reductase [Rhodospirillaceae bacterium]MDE0363576.1 enoyl-ACP reductase [Rhodospirillaceae bacterium]